MFFAVLVWQGLFCQGGLEAAVVHLRRVNGRAARATISNTTFRRDQAPVFVRHYSNDAAVKVEQLAWVCHEPDVVRDGGLGASKDVLCVDRIPFSKELHF